MQLHTPAEGQSPGADEPGSHTIARLQDLPEVFCFSFLVYRNVCVVNPFEIVELQCFNFIPI